MTHSMDEKTAQLSLELRFIRSLRYAPALVESSSLQDFSADLYDEFMKKGLFCTRPTRSDVIVCFVHQQDTIVRSDRSSFSNSAEIIKHKRA